MNNSAAWAGWATSLIGATVSGLVGAGVALLAARLHRDAERDRQVGDMMRGIGVLAGRSAEHLYAIQKRVMIEGPKLPDHEQQELATDVQQVAVDLLAQWNDATRVAVMLSDEAVHSLEQATERRDDPLALVNFPLWRLVEREPDQSKHLDDAIMAYRAISQAVMTIWSVDKRRR